MNRILRLVVFIVSFPSLGYSLSVAGELRDTTWSWNDIENVTFLPNQKTRWVGTGDRNTVTWKVTNEEERVVEGRCVANKRYKLVLEPDLQSGLLRIENGRERRIYRLEDPEVTHDNLQKTILQNIDIHEAQHKEVAAVLTKRPFNGQGARVHIDVPKFRKPFSFSASSVSLMDILSAICSDLDLKMTVEPNLVIICEKSKMYKK